MWPAANQGSYPARLPSAQKACAARAWYQWNAESTWNSGASLNSSVIGKANESAMNWATVTPMAIHGSDRRGIGRGCAWMSLKSVAMDWNVVRLDLPCGTP